jgi:uncharacterized membrane protein YkvI
MIWKGTALFLVALVGIVLFLYGANYYNGTVGWAGIILVIASFIAWVILKVYDFTRKKERLEAVKL